MFIYKITNLINKKVYIGKTERGNPRKRWSEHLKKLKSNVHVNKHLLSSYKKYGPDAFKFEVLLEINSLQELNEEEMRLIKKYKSYNSEFGYNKTFGGDGGRPTEETRLKLSEVSKGRKLTREHIEKIRKSRIGSNLPPGVKKKLSEFWTGVSRPKSIEHRNKLKQASIGNSNASKKIEPTEYVRQCSVCETKVYHKNFSALNRALKRTSMCRKCAAERRKYEHTRRKR
jgi:group I intron endonuclease